MPLGKSKLPTEDFVQNCGQDAWRGKNKRTETDVTPEVPGG